MNVYKTGMCLLMMTLIRVSIWGGTLSNLGFENGDFYQWTAQGDTSVVTHLGTIPPQDGSYMALITTGGTALSGYTSYIETEYFYLPKDAKYIYFSWKFLTNEYPTYTTKNTKYNDSFSVQLQVQNDPVKDLYSKDAIAKEKWKDSATIYNGETDWKNRKIKIAGKYRDSYVKIIFRVDDYGDSAVDTAVLLDDIFITGSGVTELDDVETPIINLGNGIYTGTQTVNVDCATSGADIYYTLDGSEPTEKSSKYKKNIEIEKTAVLKVKAFKKGYDPSLTSEASYTILLPDISDLNIWPEGGVYSNKQSVKITCSTPGVRIHYTLDGSVPDENSPKYKKSVSISKSSQLIARAFKDGYDPSPFAGEHYYFDLPEVAEVVPSKVAGVVAGEFELALTSATKGADIMYGITYSTDATVMPVPALKYKNPIAITGNARVVAYAYKKGMNNSEVIVLDYTMAGAKALTMNIPEENISGDKGTTYYYSFDVPAGIEHLWIKAGSASGKVDLHVNHGNKPLLNGKNDYEDKISLKNTKTGSKLLEVKNPESGTWFVRLTGSSDFDGAFVSYSRDMILSDYCDSSVQQSGSSTSILFENLSYFESFRDINGIEFGRFYAVPFKTVVTEGEFVQIQVELPHSEPFFGGSGEYTASLLVHSLDGAKGEISGSFGYNNITGAELKKKAGYHLKPWFNGSPNSYATFTMDISSAGGFWWWDDESTLEGVIIVYSPGMGTYYSNAKAMMKTADRSWQAFVTTWAIVTAIP